MLLELGIKAALAASKPRRLFDGRSMEGEPKSPFWSGVQGARRLPVDGMGPGQGQRESSLPGLHEMVMGYRWAAGTLPRLPVGRAVARAWCGAGGEANLQVLRVGSGRRDSPLIGFSADALTASNPRRVGLHDMVWGLGGRNAPEAMGAGRAQSLCEWLTGDTVRWLWNGLNALTEPWPGGCNGGAQRAPLPRWFCTTKHILRLILTECPAQGRALYYKRFGWLPPRCAAKEVGGRDDTHASRIRACPSHGYAANRFPLDTRAASSVRPVTPLSVAICSKL